MTLEKYFDVFSLVVTRCPLWSLEIIRVHSWSFLVNPVYF